MILLTALALIHMALLGTAAPAITIPALCALAIASSANRRSNGQ